MQIECQTYDTESVCIRPTKTVVICDKSRILLSSDILILSAEERQNWSWQDATRIPPKVEGNTRKDKSGNTVICCLLIVCFNQNSDYVGE